jgi:hypothetical protein
VFAAQEQTSQLQSSLQTPLFFELRFICAAIFSNLVITSPVLLQQLFVKFCLAPLFTVVPVNPNYIDVLRRAGATVASVSVRKMNQAAYSFDCWYISLCTDRPHSTHVF